MHLSGQPLHTLLAFTLHPWRAREAAAHSPAGPHPTITTFFPITSVSTELDSEQAAALSASKVERRAWALDIARVMWNE